MLPAQRYLNNGIAMCEETQNGERGGFCGVFFFSFVESNVLYYFVYQQERLTVTVSGKKTALFETLIKICNKRST